MAEKYRKISVDDFYEDVIKNPSYVQELITPN